MKRIAISMGSRVFAESVYLMLRQTGDFAPVRLSAAEPETLSAECRTAEAEILLMDTVPTPASLTLPARLSAADAVRRVLPGCRIVLFCDETAYPELARAVMRARQQRRIDAFFYASVSGEYLAAALDAL